jgi:hypothetical protein
MLTPKIWMGRVKKAEQLLFVNLYCMYCRQSSLYDATLQISDYYNTSAHSTEVSHGTGLPFSFFHYPLTSEDLAHIMMN